MNSPYLLVCQWCGYIKEITSLGKQPACCAPDGDGHLFIRRSTDWVNSREKAGRFRKFKNAFELTGEDTCQLKPPTTNYSS